MSGNTGLELQELRNVHEANHRSPERRGGDPHPAPGTERRKGKFQSLRRYQQLRTRVKNLQG